MMDPGSARLTPLFRDNGVFVTYAASAARRWAFSMASSIEPTM
jgi:hypothetical protein